MSEAQGNAGRHEAEPSEGHLTDSQDEAEKGIRQLINAMAEEDLVPYATDEKWPFLPRIDEHRPSRVVLIDGERGSGKTSLLLTLLKDWSREIREQSWSKSRGPILPVGIVDLAPLPKSTSLLFLLASGLRKLLSPMEWNSTANASDRAPWQTWTPPEADSIVACRDFVRRAAAGWSRDMPRRQDQLDTETYTLEIEHAEEDRLRVVESFRQFVDALGRDLHARLFPAAPRPPLIVLPLDDADMNPTKTVELLELVRTLYHPRLVFLLTGDSKLFQRTLHADISRALVRPVMRARGKSREVAEAWGYAGALASRIYAKGMPPQSRFHLDRLSIDERWEKLRSALDLVATDGGRDLEGNLLRELSLARYFAKAPFLRNALPGWMREVVDLDAEIRRITGYWLMGPVENSSNGLVAVPDSKRPLVWLVGKLFKTALEDDGLIGSEEARLKEAISTSDTNTHFQFAESVATLGCITRLLFEVEASQNDMQVSCYAIETWCMDAHGHSLPTRTSASLMLAAILALEGADDTYVQGPTHWRNPGSFFVSITVQPPGDRAFHCGWPLFDKRLVFDTMIFADCWRKLFERGRLQQGADIDEMARRFSSLALRVASDRDRLSMDAFEGEIAYESEPPNWLEIGRRAAELEQRLAGGEKGGFGPRGRYLREWVREQLLLLAAPESGLSPASCRQIFQAMREAFGPREWNVVCLAARETRRRRLKWSLSRSGEPEASDVAIEATIRIIDRQASRRSHPWPVMEKRIFRADERRRKKIKPSPPETV